MIFNKIIARIESFFEDVKVEEIAEDYLSELGKLIPSPIESLEKSITNLINEATSGNLTFRPPELEDPKDSNPLLKSLISEFEKEELKLRSDLEATKSELLHMRDSLIMGQLQVFHKDQYDCINSLMITHIEDKLEEVRDFLEDPFGDQKTFLSTQKEELKDVLEQQWGYLPNWVAAHAKMVFEYQAKEILEQTEGGIFEHGVQDGEGDLETEHFKESWTHIIKDR